MRKDDKKTTPLKAIRLWCLDCSGLQPKEIRDCERKECPLYLYRFGKNPRRKRVGNVDNLDRFSKK